MNYNKLACPECKSRKYHIESILETTYKYENTIKKGKYDTRVIWFLCDKCACKLELFWDSRWNNGVWKLLKKGEKR